MTEYAYASFTNTNFDVKNRIGADSSYRGAQSCTPGKRRIMRDQPVDRMVTFYPVMTGFRAGYDANTPCDVIPLARPHAAAQNTASVPEGIKTDCRCTAYIKRTDGCYIEAPCWKLASDHGHTKAHMTRTGRI